MTIYWERCDFCGKHEPTLRCTLYSDSQVCVQCCISCIRRGTCPVPAWLPHVGVKVEEARAEVEVEEAEKVKSVLEELLKRL